MYCFVLHCIALRLAIDRGMLFVCMYVTGWVDRYLGYGEKNSIYLFMELNHNPQ